LCVVGVVGVVVVVGVTFEGGDRMTERVNHTITIELMATLMAALVRMTPSKFETLQPGLL
jgi:hypothetical protein